MRIEVENAKYHNALAAIKNASPKDYRSFKEMVEDLQKKAIEGLRGC